MVWPVGQTMRKEDAGRMNALTHTTGYAIVALSYVGLAETAWVQATSIAEATGIPKPYLSKILHALGKSGIIRTKRGSGGGVALSRPADQVTLLDVAMAVEPLSAEPRCFLGMTRCSEEKPCPMHTFWRQIRDKTREEMARTTLARVAAHQRASGFRTPPLKLLMEDLPLPAKQYRTKPTNRFLRKFGVQA